MGKRGRGTNNSAAVMAKRAPTVVVDDTDERAIFRTLDFFPTPPWAARAGARFLLDLDPTARSVREPACGQMHIADPVAPFFDAVLASDVYPHRPTTEVRDWLDDAQWPDEPDCDWIITNPPFLTADQFVTKGLQRARNGVALLLRLAFAEGMARYPLFEGNHPLTLLAPFSERVSMSLGVWDPDDSKATAYAWFFWMKGAAPRPPRWIPPGTKRLLTLKDDAARYGVRRELPMFPDAA